MPNCQDNCQDQDTASEVGRRATDRVTRFIARMDAHLPTLPDDAARRIFLDRQLDGWERRYARFVATEGCSELVAVSTDPPQAADFLLTIIGLAARRCALDERRQADCPRDPLAPGGRRSALPGDHRPGSAAHHARFGATPKDLAQKCAQPKRDVNDLRKALADIDTAMRANEADRS